MDIVSLSMNYIGTCPVNRQVLLPVAVDLGGKTTIAGKILFG